MASVAAVHRNPYINEEDELEDANPNGGVEDAEEEDDDEEEEFDGEEVIPGDGQFTEKVWLSTLRRRLALGPVRLHVHNVVIKGNMKTKGSLIEAEVLQLFRSASTMQEVIQAADEANSRLQRLEIFDSVTIVLDAGPPELPGTTNVIIEVVEPRNLFSADIGVYARTEAQGWPFEGLLKLRNILGYGDIWDISGSYGWDQIKELDTGLSLPRFKGLSTPLTARVSLLTHDWLKFSSYKDRLLGLSLSLVSTVHHDLVYNFTWRHLTDPSRMPSTSVKWQLGHSLLSSLKYTYKIDQRDSHIRPTRGYAFLSTSQICGLGPDSKLSRYVRQEFDLRAAIPLFFLNSALNIGVAAGTIMPWGSGFLNSPTPLPDRFHMGDSSSPLCLLNGPTPLFGFRFKRKGLGPTDIRRLLPIKAEGGSDFPRTSGRDALGANITVTAFADLSFDLPPKVLRDYGIHGRVFIAAGNMAKLTEDSLKEFSVRQFAENFRTSTGFGVVVPTKLFRMEVNYCHILRRFEHDKGKSGIQFSFSPPS